METAPSGSTGVPPLCTAPLSTALSTTRRNGGPGRKRPQRLPPGGAVFHRAHSREVMRAGEYLAAQLLHGRGGGQPPQRPQRFQKNLCLWLFAFQQRRVQAAARGQQAQTRQIVRRE